MKVGASQWISWILATATAAVTMVSYAYATFETKDEARKVESRVLHRLDRIEDLVLKIYDRDQRRDSSSR